MKFFNRIIASHKLSNKRIILEIVSFTAVDIGNNAIYMNNFYPGMTKKKNKKNWNEYYMYMMISADK